MKRLVGLGLVGWLLLGPRVSWGQLIVEDPANLLVNTWTSVQTTLTTIEAVLQTAYMVLELTGFDEGSLDAEFFTDLNELQGIVGESAALMRDVQSLRQQVIHLFDLEAAPNNTTEAIARLQEIGRAINEAYLVAMEVQTLIRTAVHTVQHVRQLIARIQAFLGQKQALQNLNENTATLARVQATQLAVTTAMARAQATQGMEKALVQQMTINITIEVMADWPK